MGLSEVEWTASWHDSGADALAEIWGDSADVLAWARRQPAQERLLFDWRAETYLPLPAQGPVEVGLPAVPRRPADAASA